MLFIFSMYFDCWYNNSSWISIIIIFSELEGSLVWAVIRSVLLLSLRLLLSWWASCQSSNWATSIEFVNFGLSVFIDKLINVNISTTNSNLECFPMLSDLDFLCTEIVYTRASNLTLEHDSEFSSVGVMVHVVSHLAINWITSDWEVDTELQACDFFFKASNLKFGILELLQNFKVDFLRFIELFLNWEYLFVGLLELSLHLRFGFHGFFDVCSERCIVLFEGIIVSFLSDSNLFILCDNIFLLESALLIFRNDFLMLRLQIGDLPLVLLPQLSNKSLLLHPLFLILRDNLFLLLSRFFISQSILFILLDFFLLHLIGIFLILKSSFKALDLILEVLNKNNLFVESIASRFESLNFDILFLVVDYFLVVGILVFDLLLEWEGSVVSIVIIISITWRKS